jgi:hypothetical protein
VLYATSEELIQIGRVYQRQLARHAVGDPMLWVADGAQQAGFLVALELALQLAAARPGAHQGVVDAFFVQHGRQARAGAFVVLFQPVVQVARSADVMAGVRQLGGKVEQVDGWHVTGG